HLNEAEILAGLIEHLDSGSGRYIQSPSRVDYHTIAIAHREGCEITPARERTWGLYIEGYDRSGRLTAAAIRDVQRLIVRTEDDSIRPEIFRSDGDLARRARVIQTTR